MTYATCIHTPYRSLEGEERDAYWAHLKQFAPSHARHGSEEEAGGGGEGEGGSVFVSKWMGGSELSVEGLNAVVVVSIPAHLLSHSFCGIATGAAAGGNGAQKGEEEGA